MIWVPQKKDDFLLNSTPCQNKLKWLKKYFNYNFSLVAFQNVHSIRELLLKEIDIDTFLVYFLLQQSRIEQEMSGHLSLSLISL